MYDSAGKLAPETKHGRRTRTGKDDPGETTVLVINTPGPTLLPGQSEKQIILLNKLYDLAAPDTYTVHLERGNAQVGIAKSNAIKITVTAPTKDGGK